MSMRSKDNERLAEDVQLRGHIARVPPFKVENPARDLDVSACTVGTMPTGPSNPTA